MQHLGPRHIQNYSAASSLQPHWGYADRVIPCTNDAGSCEYLDVVYHSHDLGMLYCGILWATIVGILLIWCIHTFSTRQSADQFTLTRQGDSDEPQVGTWERVRKTVSAYRRQYLLPEFARPIFGRTTRLQVLILLVLTGYLTVFTFVGIVYRTWITPVKKMPGLHNTRTSLGPWSDRVGVFAYALTPLSVLLSSRESLLSIITGLPYQSFNFLHRWLGYIIVVQSILHTVGWCIIEMRLYQPQPSVGREWISQLYMIWGVIAMFLLFSLFILSTPWAIRRTGYEFFRKSHYVLAMLYIGACWGHWSKLECYLIPALVVWLIDRALRLARTAVLHYRHTEDGLRMRFRCTDAEITHFPDSVNGDVVRLDFQHPHDPWNIGQHFYLTFPKSSIWQSHPFTPLNAPMVKHGVVEHSYVFRAKAGETAKIAQIAYSTASRPGSSERSMPSTPVILSGPYGVSDIDSLSSMTNVLCIAGGTGITYVLPVLFSLLNTCTCSSARRVRLMWAVRQRRDLEWVQHELDAISRLAGRIDLQIDIFVTREQPVARQGPECPERQKYATANEKAVSSSTSSLTNESSKIATVLNRPCNGGTEVNVHHASVDGSQLPSVTLDIGDKPHSRPLVSGRPDLSNLINDFVESTMQGSTIVYASGPGEMVSDVRRIVADVNDGGKVWKGNMRQSVELRCDDRLEW